MLPFFEHFYENLCPQAFKHDFHESFWIYQSSVVSLLLNLQPGAHCETWNAYVFVRSNASWHLLIIYLFILFLFFCFAQTFFYARMINRISKMTWHSFKSIRQEKGANSKRLQMAFYPFAFLFRLLAYYGRNCFLHVLSVAYLFSFSFFFFFFFFFDSSLCFLLLPLRFRPIFYHYFCILLFILFFFSTIISRFVQKILSLPQKRKAIFEHFCCGNIRPLLLKPGKLIPALISHKDENCALNLKFWWGLELFKRSS